MTKPSKTSKLALTSSRIQDHYRPKSLEEGREILKTLQEIMQKPKVETEKTATKHLSFLKQLGRV